MAEVIEAGGQQGGACNCTVLRKASRRVSQLYDTALAPCGLKATQRAVLAQIGRSEPATVGRLADALVMDPGALTHNLKPLERDGFVAVTVDPADRRNRRITLTPDGRSKLAESEVLWADAQRSFEAGFGGVKADALRRALHLIVSEAFAANFK